MQGFYTDHFVLPLPAGHRFPMEKYAMLRDAVASLPGLSLQPAPAATDEELTLAHEPGYVRAMATGRVSAEQMREIGFPWSERMVERSRRSVGATIAACRAALQDGMAGNLAGGTHHASASKGAGFCVFNDAAVAARLMQAEAKASCRGNQELAVAIIDLDVHQGNGSAEIFSGDSSVFTLSVHGEKNFPFRKVPSDLDVDLPDGCADEAYLDALDAALATLERRFAPGLILYLAGSDPHENDRLGRLKLSTHGMAERDKTVFAWAVQRGIPLAFAMAGGYGKDLPTMVEVQANTWKEALRACSR